MIRVGIRAAQQVISVLSDKTGSGWFVSGGGAGGGGGGGGWGRGGGLVMVVGQGRPLGGEPPNQRLQLNSVMQLVPQTKAFYLVAFVGELNPEVLYPGLGYDPTPAVSMCDAAVGYPAS